MKLNVALCIALLSAAGGHVLYAGVRPAFPQHDGVCLEYAHYDADGSQNAGFTLSIRNMTGNQENGSLEMVYSASDRKGKPYFDGANEYVMSVRMVDGKTYVNMDKMTKTIKIRDLIISGDAGSIYVPMSVGDTLPDTQIHTALGAFKVTLTIVERKVLDHRKLTVGGGEYECWLVHEKTLTRTPVGTDTSTSDTWYAEGVGCLSQTVYNAKGKIKGRIELLGVSHH